MLNKNTQKAFKDLNTIGNSAIIRYPLTSVIQLDRALISFIDLEALGEEPFEEFGIYFLSEFLSLIDLYDGGEIERKDNIVEFKNASSTQKYETSDLEIMKIFDMPGTVLEKLLDSPTEATFTVSSDMVDRIKKVSSLLKLKSLIVDANAETKELSLIACNLSENNAYMNESNNSIPDCDITTTTKIVYDIQNILKIPSVDFNIRIIKNPTSGNHISVWEAIDEPVTIVVAVQKSLI
ncbi:MAG: hypothetical protein KAI79_05045 [Bacteroidales bacterium]|nr:hypothetical protein [Bacteroidales bacterium]